MPTGSFNRKVPVRSVFVITQAYRFLKLYFSYIFLNLLHTLIKSQ